MVIFRRLHAAHSLTILVWPGPMPLSIDVNPTMKDAHRLLTKRICIRAIYALHSNAYAVQVDPTYLLPNALFRRICDGTGHPQPYHRIMKEREREAELTSTICSHFNIAPVMLFVTLSLIKIIFIFGKKAL